MAQEYARYNVRSVVLAAGLLDVGLGVALPPEIQHRTRNRSLLGAGSGDTIAETVAFLAGPNADHINATVLHVDGGVAD